MADFLTRMTQRTLGLLPVVQPIIASKYGSESTRAYMPGASAPGDPDQATEESFEDWEGMAERVPPAPVPQPVVPRGIRMPTIPVPGVSQSAVSSQEQPSTAKIQQTKPAPVRPHAVPPLRETTGGDLSSPLVPQPQDRPELDPGREMPQGAELPGHEQAKGGKPAHLPYTKSNSDPYRVGAGLAHVLGIEASSQPQTSDQQENLPFSPAPTVSTIPTTEPGRGQGKASSRSDKSMVGEPLVPTQSGEIPQIDKKPHASIQAVPHKGGIEKQHISPLGEETSPHGNIQTASYNEVSPVREYPYVSNFSAESPALVSSSSSMPAITGDNPLVSRRNVANVSVQGAEPQFVPYTKHDADRLPGQGQGRPILYTKHNGEPVQGAEPQLVPYTKHDSDLYRVQAGLAPALVSPALVAESNTVEPEFPSVYPSAQTRRTETTVTGKREAAQPSESHEAPTIRVTIGRIDVRAVAPTPPASPAPAKSNRSHPALSLSDYLKRRKGDSHE